MRSILNVLLHVKSNRFDMPPFYLITTFVILTISNLFAQFENKPAELEDLNYYYTLNGTPKYIKEQKFMPYDPPKGDTLYEAGPVEYFFKNGYLNKTKRTDAYEKYEMELTLDTFQNEILLTRTDSFFYEDPSKVFRFGNNYNKPLNHKDTTTYLFNRNGKLLAEDNVGKWRVEYGYNDKGDPNSKKLFENDKLTGLFLWIYKYDKSGKMIECMELHNFSLSAHMLLFYHINLDVQYYIRYHNHDVEFVQTTFNFYEKNGKIDRRIAIGKHNYNVYEYNSNGDEELELSGYKDLGLPPRNLTHAQRENQNWGFHTIVNQYLYDDNDNWIKKNSLIMQNENKKFQFFNSENRQIEF